MRVGT